MTKLKDVGWFNGDDEGDKSSKLRCLSGWGFKFYGLKVHQVGEPVNADFFSIMVDGVSDHELHLDDVVKQKEQLQHLEVNLKARLIATSEVTGIHERFDSQIKDHITSNLKLQAWAKEDLLREQDKDLATFRRELDNSEAERAQHLKKSMNYKNMLKKRNDN
ncbi:hypothetical protein E3N88_16635 [Mikania micrantha]|uniref:Uncharacterized protein n=1 Tax=Mikania micrantha TaxID=192012 RepID=A0A5N6P216_9ASTR|nr:hypothetical protein E3N88_16635 [Mikania micrantha]